MDSLRSSSSPRRASNAPLHGRAHGSARRSHGLQAVLALSLCLPQAHKKLVLPSEPCTGQHADARPAHQPQRGALRASPAQWCGAQARRHSPPRSLRTARRGAGERVCAAAGAAALAVRAPDQPRPGTPDRPVAAAGGKGSPARTAQPAWPPSCASSAPRPVAASPARAPPRSASARRRSPAGRCYAPRHRAPPPCSRSRPPASPPARRAPSRVRAPASPALRRAPQDGRWKGRPPGRR